MNEVAAFAAALLTRVLRTSPRTDAVELALIAGAAAIVVLLPASWRTVRHGVTIVHEAGHGIVATVTGRRLAGIRLHSDSSGLTVSVGRTRGPGMVLTLLAGYPAPSVAGLLLAVAVRSGHAAAAFWGALVLLAAVLVQVRNWYGLWTVAVAGLGVGAATALLDPAWQARAATGLAVLLLLGGLRTTLELQGARRRERARTTDADQLARLSGVPGILWVLLLVLIAAAAAAGGALLLAPDG